VGGAIASIFRETQTPMKHISRRAPLIALLAAITLLAGIASVACGGSETNSNAEVINGINVLDKAGLHELDEQIRTEKTIPSNASTTYKQLQAVTLLTEWPTKDLQAKAKALAGLFGEAAAATAGANPDQAKAAEASKKAHDGEHDFASEVWSYLYKTAGIGAASGGH